MLKRLIFDVIHELKEVEVEIHADPIANADLLITAVIYFEVEGTLTPQLNFSHESIWTRILGIQRIHCTSGLRQIHKLALLLR